MTNKEHLIRIAVAHIKAREDARTYQEKRLDDRLRAIARQLTDDQLAETLRRSL